MIEDTIAKIEARLQADEALPAGKREELLALLGTLKTEVATLARTHGEQAESIAGFAEASTREATRGTPNRGLLTHALGGLTASVEEFEGSHPQLVQIVNSISHTLSNLGI